MLVRLEVAQVISPFNMFPIISDDRRRETTECDEAATCTEHVEVIDLRSVSSLTGSEYLRQVMGYHEMIPGTMAIDSIRRGFRCIAVLHCWLLDSFRKENYGDTEYQEMPRVIVSKDSNCIS